MSNRMLRVGRQVKEIVSEIIVRHLKDPRIGFVTIARVKVSKDLQEALIFVNVLGTEKEKKDTLKALNHASGFIQHFLGKEL
ncbi:MAG: 30S ribosome-binding factor RbfA, partial [Candidatus Auribacterota bacterium]|nr:30S ribosome-binding factor RbfA [Candidatus Auribacterota bacterium]